MPATAVPRSRCLLRASVAISAMLLVMVPCPYASTASSDSESELKERIDSVSASEMLETVQDLQDFGSRAFCLDEAKNASEYIFARFRDLGLHVQYQNFTFDGYSSSNVVAIVNGTDPDAGVFLFGAHYDSENRLATTLDLAQELPAPGADDDASGMAAVIELSEALRDLGARQTLKFVAFGAEENGFDKTGGVRGSSHFVQTEMAAGKAYECAVILDMIGYAGDPDNHGTIVTAEGDLPFTTSVKDAVDEWRLELDLEILTAPNIIYSDHAPFWSSGYPAVLVTEGLTTSYYPVNPYYHSAHDTVDKLSGRQMENVTKSLLAGALGVLDIPEQDPEPTMVLAAMLIAATAFAVILALYSRKNRKSDIT